MSVVNHESEASRSLVGLQSCGSGYPAGARLTELDVPTGKLSRDGNNRVDSIRGER